MSKRAASSGSDHARAWSLFQSNQLRDAMRIYDKICRRSRGDDGAWLMLGIIQASLGSYADAETSLKKAVSINSNNFDAQVNLGLLCYQRGMYEHALRYYQKALQLNPRHADALFQTANAYAHMDLLIDAEEHYGRALEIDPMHPLVPGNLANVLAYQGRPLDAIPMYRRALQLPLWSAAMHSNLLLCLHYRYVSDPQSLFEEHKSWATVHTRNVRSFEWDAAAFTVGGELHIGYVSPDLREHSVAYFLRPLLTCHDRSRYKITCYSDLASQDDKTRELSGAVDCLRITRGLSDDQVAEVIRQDRVDILVDLAGHTENNRLPVFARRPAPVQITYLGYPDTTGLETIDYRITDQWADPPGKSEHLHTERLLRLEGGFLCFSPPEESPCVGSSPCDTNGFITLGSFNVLTKITPEILELWAKLLQQLPDGRLLIKNRQMTDMRLRERIWCWFEENGIARGRIDILGKTSKQQHMAAYSGVDIALDTFPYNGTTTTCDTLWMGVPVVTLAGTTHVSRVGVSLLTQLGLEELVATTEQHYIETTLALASDRARLRALRGELRESMRQSTLCDAAAFCRDMESLYQDVWAGWCGSREAGA